MLLLALQMVFAAASHSQNNKKESDLRTVHGTVVDKDENAMSTCVVYLKNVRTTNVKTYITDDAGKYRFSGLDPNSDYEVYAEHQGNCSATRSISSFESRNDIDLTLKLNRKCAK
jgi:Fe-S cluster biogenesis protein NfuA